MDEDTVLKTAGLKGFESSILSASTIGNDGKLAKSASCNLVVLYYVSSILTVPTILFWLPFGDSKYILHICIMKFTNTIAVINNNMEDIIFVRGYIV